MIRAPNISNKAEDKKKRRLKMEKTVNFIKFLFASVFGLVSSALGALAVPVLMMVSCNIIDYATGLMAAKRRGQEISSYRGIDGITKKVCMWLLVVVGAIIDQLILYYSGTVGIKIPFESTVACAVAIWINCNEIISILENIKDMGVPIPAFLTPIINNIKSQVDEDKEGE